MLGRKFAEQSKEAVVATTNPKFNALPKDIKTGLFCAFGKQTLYRECRKENVATNLPDKLTNRYSNEVHRPQPRPSRNL